MNGQTLLGDFVLERELGEGGMGKVYLVRSQATGQFFAVKKTRFQDENSRRNFLAELQTWIDLAEHPHLAACRFFRTIGDEIAIFAEYVDGGSLADWIRARRLTTLRQILDVAIQFAWGLHAAHEHGLVHQDVKPGNVLMTSDGVAKVTDFGLARARARPKASGQSSLVSVGGMTPAYCSPEQMLRRPLSRKTDIWSWGLSVLEMFLGEVTWLSGAAGPEVLENYLQAGPTDPLLPRMPISLGNLLRKCFREDFEQRWGTMQELADALTRIYRLETGSNYARQVTDAPKKDVQQPVLGNRGRATGSGWIDPREWLRRAFEAAGRDPNLAKAIPSAQAGSHKAQAIADLAAFEEAQRIFERLVDDGRKDLELELALLYADKARVHTHLRDSSGALTLFDRAIILYERQLGQSWGKRLLDVLAELYQDRGFALRELGDSRTALASYDRAIELYERLVHDEKRTDLANHLARVYMNKGLALWDVGEPRPALAWYDQAIAIRERLVDLEGRGDVATGLAMAYMNKGNALADLGDARASLPLLDRAIDLYERLVRHEHREELAYQLARTYLNQGASRVDLADFRAALASYDQAGEIYERLVNREGHGELANELAMVYMNKGNALGELGEPRSALGWYDRAGDLFERLLNQEGRGEVANMLAKLYMHKGEAHWRVGDWFAGLELLERCIAIRERLVNQEGRTEFAGALAKAKALRDEYRSFLAAG